MAVSMPVVFGVNAPVARSGRTGGKGKELGKERAGLFVRKQGRCHWACLCRGLFRLKVGNAVVEGNVGHDVFKGK